MLFPESLFGEQGVKETQMEASALPSETIVSWAASFAYEGAFPVLSNDHNLRSIRFYGLDAFTFAPFSVATAERKAGREMIHRLQTAEGLPIIAFDSYLNMLRIYCEERNGQFEKLTSEVSPLIRQVRCLTSK